MNDNNEIKSEELEIKNSNEFNINITDSTGKEFSGPFELFYSLIKERKMDILNINLAEIIQLYVNYINENFNKLKIDDLTEYLLMATYLLEQKSKKIIPSMETDEDVANDIERDKYIQRLLVYKQYQEIVPKLVEQMNKRSRMFERPKPTHEEQISILKEFQQDDFIDTMDLNVILKAMQKVYLKLINTKKTRSTTAGGKDNVKVIGVNEISIDDVEKEIRDFFEPFPHLYRISFMDYFKQIPDEKFTRRYFVVAFVAFLVLVRNGFIQLEQNDNEEDIFIVKIDKEEVENSEY
ncbi:MAG: segregation/condensation protein A [Malacoplasma sp.]|nr:segregation/condensation protein A [Malacoplasma sp.]MDE6893979.1 segregation/condensation protein A [Malacoplasma sp.]MDE7088045.1 segregation/condensation protein A [Malacoplasma sp.]